MTEQVYVIKTPPPLAGRKCVIRCVLRWQGDLISAVRMLDTGAIHFVRKSQLRVIATGEVDNER